MPLGCIFDTYTKPATIVQIQDCNELQELQSHGITLHGDTMPEQLFSSRFGNLIDGMGSTQFTIPIANLTMEEWNLLERVDKWRRLTKCAKHGKAKTFKLLPSVGYKHDMSLAPAGISSIGK